MLARLAFAATAVAALTGCAGGRAARPIIGAPAPATATQAGVSSGVSAVASSYTLVSVDGHALPYARVDTKSETPSTTQIVSGTLDLRPDGTFTMSTQYRAVEPSKRRTISDVRRSAAVVDSVRYTRSRCTASLPTSDRPTSRLSSDRGWPCLTSSCRTTPWT